MAVFLWVLMHNVFSSRGSKFIIELSRAPDKGQLIDTPPQTHKAKMPENVGVFPERRFALK
jgi:hypothetical protein